MVADWNIFYPSIIIIHHSHPSSCRQIVDIEAWFRFTEVIDWDVLRDLRSLLAADWPRSFASRATFPHSEPRTPNATLVMAEISRITASNISLHLWHFVTNLYRFRKSKHFAMVRRIRWRGAAVLAASSLFLAFREPKQRENGRNSVFSRSHAPGPVGQPMEGAWVDLAQPGSARDT